MQLSRYVISTSFEDIVSGLKKAVLFSTRSGETRVVPEDLYEKLQQSRFDALSEDLIENLKEGIFLVDSNANELSQVVVENNEARANSREFYLVVQPTAYCPLGCAYCGQVHSPEQMGEDVRRGVETIVDRELSSGRYDRIHVKWFGGEPLSGLKSISDLSPRLMSLAKSHNVGYRASMVTNGYLLDHKVATDLVTRWKIKRFEITLDGIASYHDERRHTKEKQRTFERIYANLKALALNDTLSATVSVRCNVDRHNVEGVLPLIEKLAADGLHRKVYFYTAPIHGWGNGAEERALPRDEYAQRELDWLTEMNSLGFHVSLLPHRKRELCLAVSESGVLVDAKGNLYNCTEVSMVPSYEEDGKNVHALGRVDSDKIDSKIRSYFGDFYQDVLANKVPCTTCSLLPTCGGACPKEWKEGHIPCPSTRDNIKDRLLLNIATKGLRHVASEASDVSINQIEAMFL